MEAMAREDRALIERMDRRLRIRLLLGTGAGALVLAGFVLLTAHAEAFGAYLRGETDLLGRLYYEPEREPDPAALAGIDLERVHAALLPTWIVALGSAHTPWGHRRADEAYAALQAEVEPDENLTALLDELRTLVHRGQLVDHADRLFYLCWAWSAYLDEQQQPYWIHGSVIVSSGDATFYVKSYRVLHDLRVAVGDETYRARIITRLDSLNVTEAYLGATSKDSDGAFLLAERVLEFAADHVWPLLDPALDEQQDDRVRDFLEPLRREAVRALDPAELTLLRDTAPVRRNVLDAVAAIESRRECGSQFVVNEVPWNGFGLHDLVVFDGHSELDEEIECPAVTAAEAETLIEGSRKLRHTEGLAEAVGALTAWLARGIVIHEARHVADDAEVDGLETPMDCRGCPPRSSVTVRAEISAYLASLAWSESPAVALFQVCQALEAGPGPHVSALDLILERLGRACVDGPSGDLQARARALEQELFGRSDPIGLPDDFPARLTMP